MDELNNAKRNRIWERMEQNRPKLYHMIQNDDFIAVPITQTGTQILTPRRTREVYTDVFEHDGATYAVCASEPTKYLYLSIWKRTGDDKRQVHLSFAKTRRTLMMRLAKFKANLIVEQAKLESRRSCDPVHGSGEDR
jgi:hypothetical protein